MLPVETLGSYKHAFDNLQNGWETSKEAFQRIYRRREELLEELSDNIWDSQATRKLTRLNSLEKKIRERARNSFPTAYAAARELGTYSQASTDKQRWVTNANDLAFQLGASMLLMDTTEEIIDAESKFLEEKTILTFEEYKRTTEKHNPKLIQSSAYKQSRHVLKHSNKDEDYYDSLSTSGAIGGAAGAAISVIPSAMTGVEDPSGILLYIGTIGIGFVLGVAKRKKDIIKNQAQQTYRPEIAPSEALKQYLPTRQHTSLLPLSDSI